MSPADRDTARAQQIARTFTRLGSARYSEAFDAIAQALAEVRAEASAYFNQTCADHPDVRLDLACEKCIEEQLAPPAPERREAQP